MATDTASHYTTEPSIMQSRPGTGLFNPSNLTQKYQQFDLAYNKTNSTAAFSKTSKFTNLQPKVSNDSRNQIINMTNANIENSLKRPKTATGKKSKESMRLYQADQNMSVNSSFYQFSNQRGLDPAQYKHVSRNNYLDITQFGVEGSLLDIAQH